MEQAAIINYSKKVRDAIIMWEEYTDAKKLTPVFSVVDLVCDPQIYDHEKVARDLLGVLTRLMCKHMTYQNNTTAGEDEYIRLLMKNSREALCPNKAGVIRWVSTYLKDWPDRTEFESFQAAFNVLMHSNIGRWYKTTSCDDYKEGMLMILHSALAEIEGLGEEGFEESAI